jgi:hypothetical protein
MCRCRRLQGLSRGRRLLLRQGRWRQWCESIMTRGRGLPRGGEILSRDYLLIERVSCLSFTNLSKQSYITAHCHVAGSADGSTISSTYMRRRGQVRNCTRKRIYKIRVVQSLSSRVRHGCRCFQPWYLIAVDINEAMPRSTLLIGLLLPLSGQPQRSEASNIVDQQNGEEACDCRNRERDDRFEILVSLGLCVGD